MFRFFFFLIVLIRFSCVAQEFTVKPYLQNAGPNSIVISWEYSNYDSSFLEWGKTSNLGNTVAVSHEFTNFPACLYSGSILGLEEKTKYFYRVISGSSVSNIYSFVTPANTLQEKSINIVVMSDMQRDGNNPNKFHEIVHDGIFEYINTHYDSDISKGLDLIMIPGDLVGTGTDYNHWKDQFFAPAYPLFSFVPLYPVLGNHEMNSDFFFKYFDLPLNGTPGFEEHWWFKDNSNVRIIGLNSNPGYRIQKQLDWLDSLLYLTSMDSSIDFVFAQLHHPHKSEQWTPGNTDFTGEIVELLENFTKSCGKPSVHFYGHTHGYSRGQSKEHTHLMVNVATSGGYIDYWGEWPQQDYEEYSISQDEWGYVFLEIQAGNDPQFTLRRLSLGDDNIVKKNSIEDSVVIRLYNNSPNTPVGIFPSPFDTISSNSMILIADDFIDIDDDLHGASHWQISDNCNDFSNLIFDSWKQYENWYFDINTQQSDDLTDEQIEYLQPSSNYCWRVRYRDRSLAWSQWSSPIPFYTDESIITKNLIKVVDILGRNIKAQNNIIGFYVYDDGSVEKKIVFD